jgi:CheY-like chemotaxis protein
MPLTQPALCRSIDSTGSHHEAPDTEWPILVVEDEFLVRMMIADVLEDAGFKVIEATNADEALRVLRAVGNVRAVITDVEMPNGSMNGFELAKRIREEWKIGVLIASGRATPKLGELPEGSHFIAKPLYPATLLSLLHMLIQPT